MPIVGSGYDSVALKLKIGLFTYTQEIDVSSLNRGANSIKITNQSVIDALNNAPLGATFQNWMDITYVPGFLAMGETIPFSTSYYTPNQLTATFEVSDIPTRTTADADEFSIVNLVTKTGTGVVSYSSSNPSVATINFEGMVNVLSAGTTYITFHLEASADNVYKAATSITKILTITPPTWYIRGLDIDGEAAGDQSGTSVSLSADGTMVAIGAPHNSDNGSNRGQVRLYKWDTTTSSWWQHGQDINGEAAGDQSGTSVSLSADGTKVAIGAPGNAPGNVSFKGHTRVYEWDFVFMTWRKLGQDIDGEAMFDESGASVSLSADGTIVAIGARLNFSDNNIKTGHARVYEWNGSEWVKVGQDIDGEMNDNRSGYSVSLSANGTKIAISAPFNYGNYVDSGHVRVYEWNIVSSLWAKVGQDIDGESANEQSGYSVSLSADGTKVAIGAPFNDSSRGRVKVWEWNSTTSLWVQLGQAILGQAAGEESGTSVSLSADGTKVAIGAPFNDSSRGRVRLFEWNSTTSLWVAFGQNIDGEAANDRSGRSVSLSADGTKVAIGAPYNGGNGINSGDTRVYEYR
jgi:hypothetical protein